MAAEKELVRRIVNGDSEAWQGFVLHYSPFLKKTIGRYVRDGELLEDLYVSLLEKLFNEKLNSFSGRSSLSTWLFIVTRNHCRDYFRSDGGIRHVMGVLGALDTKDARFFKLFYLHGLPINEVLKSMQTEIDVSISYLDLIECDERLKERISEKKFGNILERLLTVKRPRPLPILGNETGGIAAHPAFGSSLPPPDTLLDGQVLAEAIDNLRSALLKLPCRDRLILKLRFEHKASARRICEILDLGNEKQVYRTLNRLFVKLKEMLLERGLPLELYNEIAGRMEELCSLRDFWYDGPGSNQAPENKGL